jgi:hypothetical protein
MTDDRFTELVNLYFDKEISADDLERLKSEIAARPDRKRAFAERCRLHKAMRMALKPEKAQPRSSETRRRVKTSQLERSMRSPDVARLPRWTLASGLAASVVIGMMLLPPVFRDTTDPGAQPAFVGVNERDLIGENPLEALGRSELRRYEVLQQRREAKRHASLVAQMRLMGLRPEMTPEDKDLREVSLAAAYQPREHVSQAELFQRIQGLKAIPEPQLLRVDEAELSTEPAWSDIPEPTFVGFEKL